MIKLQNKARVREITAPYEFTDDQGEQKTDTIRVRYFSPTHADLRDLRNEFNARKADDDEATMYLSDVLAKRLESLPDIGDADGKPIEMTVENLDQIPIKNLKAIQDAIDEDIEGKLPPPTSPSG